MRYSVRIFIPVLSAVFLLLGLAFAAASAVLPSAPDPQASFPSLGIRVIGIVSSQSKSRAFIATKDREDGTLVSEGDLVEASAGGYYTVLRIGDETVELRKGDEQQILAIPGVAVLKPAAEKIQIACRPSREKNDPSKALAESGKAAKSVPKKKDGTTQDKKIAASQTPKFQRPIEGWISSPFGLRRAPRSFSGLRGSERHEGTDVAGPLGTAVCASAAGVVTESASPLFDPRGHHIIIRHSGGYETRYYHLSRRYVKEGDTVKAGQRIASEGNTGISTGPHLHFEIRKNGVAFDPSLFVPSLRKR